MALNPKVRGARAARLTNTMALIPPQLNADNADALLTRAQAGAALRAAGYPVADKTLATMACRGGGPAYRRFGARVLYRWGDALAWAQARLSKAITTTSELDVTPSDGGHSLQRLLASKSATPVPGGPRRRGRPPRKVPAPPPRNRA